jgi:cytolysin-activating lysine-acyltransferase
MTDDLVNDPSRGEQNQSEEGISDGTDTTIKSRELAARLPAFGYATWLLGHSPSHRQLFIQDLEWRVLPPIVLEQNKHILDSKVGGLPTAYVSWAFLSKEAEHTYHTTHRLRPNDWRSGDSLWLVDFVTPFGGAGMLMEELYCQIHRDFEINLMYPLDGGEPVATTLSEVLRRQSSRDMADPDDDTETNTRH